MVKKKIVCIAVLAISFACGAQYSGNKKSAPPVKPAAPARNISGPEASVITISAEHNGEKTEIRNTQFETWGGTAVPNGTGTSLILNYGASNSRKNNESFSWMFTIPKAEKGVYTVNERQGNGPGTSLQFMTSAFPSIPLFICKSGSITIEDCPLPGGFVKGTFNVVLTGGVTTDGQLDESLYTVSGSFSILRQ